MGLFRKKGVRFIYEMENLSFIMFYKVIGEHYA